MDFSSDTSTADEVVALADSTALAGLKSETRKSGIRVKRCMRSQASSMRNETAVFIHKKRDVPKIGRPVMVDKVDLVTVMQG